MTKAKLMLKLSAYKVSFAILITLLLVAGVLSVKAYYGEAKVVVEGDYIEANSASQSQELGAVSSPDVYSDLRVHGRFLQGGTICTDAPTVATSTADTITISQIYGCSGVDYTPGVAAMNITLPASSTFSYLNYGECTDWRWRNLDATAATSTTFVAGAGMDMVENESGDVVIEGGNKANLIFCKENDGSVTTYVDEYIAAD